MCSLQQDCIRNEKQDRPSLNARVGPLFSPDWSALALRLAGNQLPPAAPLTAKKKENVPGVVKMQSDACFPRSEPHWVRWDLILVKDA